MRPVAPAIWPGPRTVAALFAIALLVALASAFAAFAWVAAVVLAALVALVAVDLALGPSVRTLRIAREPLETLALGARGALRYALENRAPLGVRIGLLEPVCALLAFEDEHCAVELPAASTFAYERPLRAVRRGRAELGAAFAWAESTLGLVRRRFALEGAIEVRVLPDLAALERYGRLAQRASLVESGLRRLRRRGLGTEFESLREYRPGDPFSAIAWKATARRGRPIVVQHEVERGQTVVVTLDCGRALWARAGDRRGFEYALAAALSAATIAERAGDRVGFLAYGARPLANLAPRAGRAQIEALVRTALEIEPRLEEPDYETIFLELGRARSRRSLVVVFSDVIDPVASQALIVALRALAGRPLVRAALANDGVLASALAAPPRDPEEAYRTAVALSLADRRAQALAQLRSGGIVVVDVPAPRLSVAALDAYLAIKERRLL